MISLPTAGRFASTVRLIAAALGTDAGFSLDELDDLRLALSEAFSLVSDGASDGDRVSIEIIVVARTMTVTLRSEAGRDCPTPDDLAFTILSSVVDSFEVNGGITLVKVGRETAAAASTA